MKTRGFERYVIEKFLEMSTICIVYIYTTHIYIYE